MLSFLLATICLFSPPSGWEMAPLKTPSPYVLIRFVGQGATPFRPSMNLAIEEVDITLKEYVKAVQQIHQADPKMRWRDLGPLAMQAGEGRLIELSSSSPYGEMKILQAFFIQENKAYILSTAVLKEEFAQFQWDILKAFRSVHLVPDLGCSIADPAERIEFQDLVASLSSVGHREEERQKLVRQLMRHVETHSQLGAYWQYLALQEGLAKIDPMQKE